ncbi:MAG: BON domain-containing protein [Planctomycetia bacterium]|nr:BON domain-containing protein [Planctomycetia bacterium]
MLSLRFLLNRRAAALCGALLLVHPTDAETPVGPAPRQTAAPALAEKDPLHDTRLTIRARQAIQQDPALAELKTINVSVRANVATLWGSVPSRDLSRRAETKVRQVQGVFEVKNELHVQGPDDSMARFMQTPPRQPSGSSERLWFMANRPPALLTGRPEDLDTKLGSPPSSDSNGVALLPPIRLGAPEQPPAPTVVAPQAAPAPAPDLGLALERLRQAEPRFWNLRAEVEGRAVRIVGRAARTEDAFDFAHAVSRVPDVERVILGEVKIAR